MKQFLRDFLFHQSQAALAYQECLEVLNAAKRMAARQMAPTADSVARTPPAARDLSTQTFNRDIAELLVTLGLGDVITNPAHARHALRRGDNISADEFLESWTSRVEQHVPPPPPGGTGHE